MKSEERLVALAAAVADCEPADWPSAESSGGSDEGRGVVANRRVLAALGSVHRTEADESNLTHTAVPGAAAAAVAAESQAMPRWGPFLLLERLGGGSQGDVFRAVDTRLDRQVALKFLKRPAHEHVLSEARLLARVRHPNVVTVYGADLIDGRVGLWMELITGDTLDAMIGARGPMSAAEATIVGVDLCRAVGAVHLAGLLHRDVKAQNVMRRAEAATSSWTSAPATPRTTPPGGARPRARRSIWRRKSSTASPRRSSPTSTRSACCCSS